MKKRIYSGTQPTGIITIGNYLGAIKNWLLLQKDNDCIFSIVDLHALTIKQNPEEFKDKSLSFLAQYIACGLSPEKSILYVQSHVLEHTALCWLLNCMTYIGECNRMTQFKDKSKKHEDNINMGLMDYPVLMAADILLYKTDLVPIGIDQKQHLELARNLAERFNARYCDTFTVPDGFIPTVGAKIKSLQNPEFKMSKSDSNENASVGILDTPEIILKKFKRAVTDSENKVCYDENRPGISNLINIYCGFTGCSREDVEKQFSDGGYGKFKLAVADAVISVLEPIQKEYAKIMNDKKYLLNVIKEGDEKARNIASKTLREVYDKMGIV